VTHTAAIVSFSEAAEVTSPKFSGTMASDFRFTPNVSTVEGSYPMAFVKSFGQASPNAFPGVQCPDDRDP
jgi:hypothetical protein